MENCGKCKREKVNGKCPACGRPTKYEGDEIMVAKVEEYLKKTIDEEWVDEKGTRQIKVNLPMLEGFALMLDIDDDTLVEWRKEYPKFSAACKKIEQEQKQRLINMGLSGMYNPTIAKLGLSANHGMAEKQDIDQKLSGSVSLSNILDAAKESKE